VIPARRADRLRGACPGGESRAREAAGERTVLAGLVLLALTASGFAGYAIATGTHEYAVQAVLPAGTAPFTWKKTVAQGRSHQ
jgi:hypothetical protein